MKTILKTKRQEFIDILNKEDIPYKITPPFRGVMKNNKSSPSGGYKIIIGGSYINSKLITYIPDNVEFNNKSFVSLSSLKKMGNNIKFNNKHNVWLISIFYFNTFSVNFTNNIYDVFFGKETFWMNYFPYQIYPNIKGNFRMWNDKKDEWEIIK